MYDELNDEEAVLSESEIEMLESVQKGRFPVGFDPYEEFGEIFPRSDFQEPFLNVPEPKRRFLPSQHEAKLVAKMVRRILEERARGVVAPPAQPDVYNLWATTGPDTPLSRLAAPKMQLPGHAESYNPPAEYLWTDEEIAAWKKKDPSDRKLDFVPQQYHSLREVLIHQYVTVCTYECVTGTCIQTICHGAI